MHLLTRNGAVLLFACWVAQLPACTPARPYYTGPGSMAATLPYQARPTWLGQDTAATYLSAYGGPAFRYNEYDDNVAFGGQLHRAWVWQNIGASVGAFGSGGRYTYAERYVPEPLAQLNYGVAGIQAGGGFFPTTDYRVTTQSGALSTSTPRWRASGGQWPVGAPGRWTSRGSRYFTQPTYPIRPG